MNRYPVRFLISVLIAAIFAPLVSGTTLYYRLSWRGDPATTMVVGWRQSGGSGATVHYGTTDHGTNYSAYPYSATPSRNTVAKGMNHSFARLTGLSPNTAYYF